ncbi:MAG: ATP-binding protein [Planctomycetes bacterium]|nr:ATP-binding protein [Planctomycetota bacterium]
MAQERNTTTEQLPETPEGFRRADSPGPGKILARTQADGGIQQDSQIQAALNRLLGLSLQNLTLEEMLEQAIDQMTSLPWCALSKGAIFLADDQRQVLTLMAQRGLPAVFLTACACIPFGECLCGRAARSDDIEFVNCVDGRHEKASADMEPHGHYCVPILSGGKVLGVINTCVKEGHARNRKEEDFLRAAAAVIAGSIERKQAEKQQAQLLQKLSEINQELKDFAYIVSHDLKAPLRAIRTIADWLQADYADKLDAEGREHLTLLTNRVNRMQNLIDGVLQYSRIGRTEQGTVPVDLGRVVPEIIENLDAPQHIAIHIESDLPTVDADPTRITQVFQNLLSNAIKYMDKPQGRITVACAEQGTFWQFHVSDNGPGIEAKDFERIFKLFQTLGPRDGSESTGIGLTIAKKIVELYNGRIWVESEVGQGSTFFFTFPKRSAAVAAEPLQTCAIG